MISRKAQQGRAELLAQIKAIEPATAKMVAGRVYGRTDPVACIQMAQRMAALRKAGAIEFVAFEDRPSGMSGTFPALWRIKREDRTENTLPLGNGSRIIRP